MESKFETDYEVKPCLRGEPYTTHPAFAHSPETRKACVWGLAITSLLAAGAIAAGAITANWTLAEASLPQVNGVREVIVLALNLCVTLASETVGYIHATTLRWALYHEGRLRLNSNLRLFTTAKGSLANSWLVNAIWVIALILAYTSASQALIISQAGDSYSLNPTSIIVLGAALLCQCIIAAWCLFPSKKHPVLSWNSNPLNTALALSRHEGTPPSASTASDAITIPKARQPSVSAFQRMAKWIVIYLWVLVVLCAIWGAVIWYLCIKDNGSPDLSFSPSQNQDSLFSTIRTTSIGLLVIIAAIQTLYTLALHSAEQLVNLHRDEVQWRAAAKRVGATIAPDSTKAAFTSIPAVFLFVLKPVSHWLFGTSATAYGDTGETFAYVWGIVAFQPLPIFTLGIAALLLASSATYLTYWKPAGPQPACYGDLDRLRRFIDDWGEGASGRIWWGDKGISSEATGEAVRRAGTSGHLDGVGLIVPGVQYVGLS